MHTNYNTETLTLMVTIKN